MTQDPTMFWEQTGMKKETVQVLVDLFARHGYDAKPSYVGGGAWEIQPLEDKRYVRLGDFAKGGVWAGFCVCTTGTRLDTQEEMILFQKELCDANRLAMVAMGIIHSTGTV